MSTIKQLEKLLEKKDKERIKIQNELDDLENKKNLPGLKKKYEGKYFKYENGYNENDRWFIYIYCKEVINNIESICIGFEQDIRGEWAFSNNKSNLGFWLYQTPITEEEFFEHLNEMIDSATSLLNL